jgi:hypothetical protein
MSALSCQRRTIAVIPAAGNQETIMKALWTMVFVAAALSGAAPAHADGFAYTGSPKQGEFFVRQRAAPRTPDWMNARAEAPQPAPRPVRGGIGLRMP